MKCPYCDKQINGFTGLQEVEKFKKHLNRGCTKNPKRLVDKTGYVSYVTLEDALKIRAESGQ